jgi:hypothetical protein
MNPRQAYQQFVKSELGRDLIGKIEAMIEANHQLAESEMGEDCVYYMNRARGNREVLSMLQSMSAELKGGKPE